MSPNPSSATSGERGKGAGKGAEETIDLVAAEPARNSGSRTVSPDARPWSRTSRYVRNPRTGLAHADNWTPSPPAPRTEPPLHNRREDPSPPRPEPTPTGEALAPAPSIQALLDLNPDGVVIVDRDELVLFHNERAAELLAMHPDDLRTGRFQHAHSVSPRNIDVRNDRGARTRIEISSTPIEVFGAAARAVVLRSIGEASGPIDGDPVNFYDALTTLPGRELLLNRAHDALRAERQDASDGLVAIARIDLDQFRRVNEFYGTTTGDRILQAVAARVTTMVRPGDHVARLGSDDFAVLLGAAPLDDQVAVAERIIESLQQPFDLDGHTIRCHPSVGLARHQADQGAEELLVAAEAALVGDRMHGEGGSGSVALGDDRAESTQHRETVSRSVARGLEEDQLFLLYQPIFSLTDGQIVSLEALVRWEHPDDGLISAGEFIRMADQSGAIVSLGEWVLTEVVDQILEWRERRPDAVIPPVSINVTGRQLLYPGFRRHALMTLARRGLDPSSLRFEVTEVALMDRRSRIDQILDELAGDGFEIDLDDFGTGLSSMAHLREFPISAIKIDGSFVRTMLENEPARRLVEASIFAAHAFEIAVVAEQVETPEQKAALERWGCDLVQGYLMARPLNPVEASRFFVSAAPPSSPLPRSQGLLRRQS